MSPRRFGKSSLILKAVKSLNRPVLAIDMQLVTSPADLGAQILKRIYRNFPAQKIKQYIKKFRIIPTLSVNPVTGAIEVSFQPVSDHLPIIEDVLDLAEKISSVRKKAVIIFDEFQDASKIHPDMLKQLRAIMQHHKMVNYVFLGSQESLIREIFQKVKSPFYHFGTVMQLSKIPAAEFREFLVSNFTGVTRNPESTADQVISITGCHPYYTQQLAFTIWERSCLQPEGLTFTDDSVNEILMIHDMDYERIWYNFNRTDRKLLIGLALSGLTPLSEAFYRTWDIGAASTAFSSLKRLMTNGYIIKTDNRYEIDDPFFTIWIRKRREA
jgi:AAA+ ATPase superfamily predicted ATPase